MATVLETYEALATGVGKLEDEAERLAKQIASMRAEMGSMRAAYEAERTRAFTLENPTDKVALEMAAWIAGIVGQDRTGMVEMYADEAVGPVLGTQHVKTLPPAVLDKLGVLLNKRVTVVPGSAAFWVEAYGEYVGCRMSPPLPEELDGEVAIAGRAAAVACTPGYWGKLKYECWEGSTDGRRMAFCIDGYSPWAGETPKLALLLEPTKRPSPTPLSTPSPKRHKSLSGGQSPEP